MSLPQQPLQLSYLGLVLTAVTVAAECSFGILSEFISPPGWKTQMDAVLAGDLS